MLNFTLVITTVTVRNVTFFKPRVIFSTLKGTDDLTFLTVATILSESRNFFTQMKPCKYGHFCRPVAVKLWFIASNPLVLHSLLKT